MIFKVPSLTCDNEVVAEDLKANVNAFTRQARIKLNLIGSDDRASPVDLVLSYISIPHIEAMSRVVWNIQGDEQVTNKHINLTFGYNFIRSRWSCSGEIGRKTIHEDVNKISDLITLIKKMCQ